MSQISVLLYTTSDCQPVPVEPDESCEAVCQRMCKLLDISPACTLLFALRVRSTGDFLPASRAVAGGETYEFRLRFQISDLTVLKRMSRVAYNYFYHQVKFDLIAARIPGLEYPQSKDQVTGLCVTFMYVDMLEKHLSVDDLMANYERYVPAKYVKKHALFIRQAISKTMNRIRNVNHDSYYAKGAVLDTIKSLAPNYLVERCAGMAAYLDEDELNTTGSCPVELEFSPYHPDRSGLSVYYPYKKRWQHVCRIDDLYAITIKQSAEPAAVYNVGFEIRDNPSGFAVRIAAKPALDSFVSCICGYYRLMVKWTVNVCSDFKSPQLERLLRDKCHGPIGGQYAYVKLQEKQSTAGAYIVRQCERSYDTYYIDIIIKGQQPETFKLTSAYNNTWQLHGHDGSLQTFSTLTDLANSIPTATRKLRLAPSEYDKTPTLLLCLSANQLTAKKTLSNITEFEMRKQNTQILHATKDFRKYLKTAKLTDDGIIKEMKADWMLPDDKKLEVTLKVLQDESKLMDFMHLADKWSSLLAPELVKMYGFTLSKPQTFVIESIKMGPLDEFLRTQKQTVSVGCLLDASYSLARALHYLQENNFVHGRIRCCKLQVVKFASPNLLIVRLGDPGFQRPFQPNDAPWIPLDYAKRTHTQLNFKDEIWAFATTLWEIFARGYTPTAKYYRQCKHQLPQPVGCPPDVYAIMREGWDVNAERRFTPQMIFSRLIAARDGLRNTYTHISPHGSAQSVNTDNTNLSAGCDGASSSASESSTHSGYVDGGHSSASVHTGAGGAPDCVTLCDADTSAHTEFTSSTSSGATSLLHTPSEGLRNGADLCSAGGGSVAAAGNNSSGGGAAGGAGGCPPVKELAYSAFDLIDGSRIVLQGCIGYGNYGSVYRGQMEDIDERVTAVAVKMFNMSTGQLGDFEREFAIMRRLNHPNIVRIITFIDEPVAIVMELVEHRSFLMYLNSRAPTLTTQMLLKFALDIASGMQYLVGQQIVHRDLAARNVLVDSNECVKISDFGLAQPTDPYGYYMVQNSRSVPIKWYAPETLAFVKYSHASDVWSFGVTLYEMFSRGADPALKPGTELTYDEMLTLLQAGVRLSKPPLCPDSIYEDLMMACWHLEAKQRPTFAAICKKLSMFVAEFGEVV